MLFLPYQPRRRDRALGEEGLVHSCWAALRFAALFYALQARACWSGCMLSRPHSRTPGRSRCTCCARNLLSCALLWIVHALLLGACCARVWWVCARDSALCARLFIVCALLFIFCAQLSSAFCACVLGVGARGFCFLCATFYFLCAILTPIVYR